MISIVTGGPYHLPCRTVSPDPGKVLLSGEILAIPVAADAASMLSNVSLAFHLQYRQYDSPLVDGGDISKQQQECGGASTVLIIFFYEV